MSVVSNGPVLVIAPHPDDEVLGVGGTIARLVDEGCDVFVAIVTKGDESMFDASLIETTRAEAVSAHEVLGVHKSIFMDGFPAALLDTLPHAQLNAAIGDVVRSVEPETMFVPFPGDLHLDHRLILDSALVAARPRSGSMLRAIYAYETLSETNWNAAPLTPGFIPNTFVDISTHLQRKLEAMSRYETQLHPGPHERSLDAIEALARFRGATVGFGAAEAFSLVRSLHPVAESSDRSLR
jgi:N-acetylglucosamine malate deacetylase 1